MSTSPSLRRRNNRHERGLAQPKPSNKRRRTQSVPRTESGHLSQRAVAEKTAEALSDYSEGEIAVVADCSKDTAQSWKLGRRAANTAYMLTLARSIDEVGMMMAEAADLGRFFDRDGDALKVLQRRALDESPEGRFARDILREIANRNLS